MDQEAVAKLGGVISKATVTSRKAIARKMDEGAWDTDEKGLTLEFELAAGADLKAVTDTLQAYCDAHVARALKIPLEELRAGGRTPEGVAMDAAALAYHEERAARAENIAGKVAQAAASEPQKAEPQRVPMDDEGNEYEVIDFASLTVQFTPTGKKVGKVKGGPYTKIGVTVWPEVLKLVGVDIEPLSAGEYTPPELAGKKARCLMKISDKSGKPYPEKVVAFL